MSSEQHMTAVVVGCRKKPINSVLGVPFLSAFLQMSLEILPFFPLGLLLFHCAL